MLLGVDHFVVVAGDLSAAMRDYAGPGVVSSSIADNRM